MDVPRPVNAAFQGTAGALGVPGAPSGLGGGVRPLSGGGSWWTNRSPAPAPLRRKSPRGPRRFLSVQSCRSIWRNGSFRESTGNMQGPESLPNPQEGMASLKRKPRPRGGPSVEDGRALAVVGDHWVLRPRGACSVITAWISVM